MGWISNGYGGSVRWASGRVGQGMGKGSLGLLKAS